MNLTCLNCGAFIGEGNFCCKECEQEYRVWINEQKDM